MNCSETTFVLSDEKRPGNQGVRILIPREEVPFAGHPTLETAYMLAREIETEPVERFALNLKAGQIPVDIGDVC